MDDNFQPAGGLYEESAPPRHHRSRRRSSIAAGTSLEVTPENRAIERSTCYNDFAESPGVKRKPRRLASISFWSRRIREIHRSLKNYATASISANSSQFTQLLNPLGVSSKFEQLSQHLAYAHRLHAPAHIITADGADYLPMGHR